MTELQNIILEVKKRSEFNYHLFYSGNKIKVTIRTQNPLMGHIVLSAVRNDPCGIVERTHLEVGHASEIYFYSC